MQRGGAGEGGGEGAHGAWSLTFSSASAASCAASNRRSRPREKTSVITLNAAADGALAAYEELRSYMQARLPGGISARSCF